jgi:hypothetical protein
LPAPPQGRQEWVRYHMGCMALIKEGDWDGAIEKLEFACEANPFKLDQPYFISAMVTALIGRRRFDEGLSWLDRQSEIGQTSISQARNRLLRAHSLFAQEKREDGILLLRQIPDYGSSMVKEAKTALERRYVGTPVISMIPQLEAEIREAEIRLLMVG